MCGIIAATAKRNIVQILINCLYKLEYRGYDSSGIAIVDYRKKLKRFREAGKVQILADKIKKYSIKGFTGIAHTRWATHGKPTKRNAHPHISEYIAIVHNGIIENYRDLRKQLKKKKYIFTSETDSEVIAHLVHLELKKNNILLDVVQKIISKLKGAYSIVIMDSRNPNLLVGARFGSPLVVGLGVNENFLASDCLAFSDLTDRLIYLEEGDIVEITWKKVCIFNKMGLKVNRDQIQSDIKSNICDKGNYKHYMKKEIFEQPLSIRKTLEGRLNKDDTIYFKEFDNEIKSILVQVENVYIIACGSSYNAGMVARYWFESLVKIPCNVEIASEYLYRNFVIQKNSLLVILSQSGETADILSALRISKKKNVYLASIAICNVLGSTLIRESDFFLMTRAGTEISVASTKGFITQLTILLLFIGYVVRIRNKNIFLEKKIAKVLRILPNRVGSVFLERNNIKKIAKDFFDKKSAIFLGRDIHFPIAIEGALKLKEISYIHAEAYPAGELKHGPLALIDSNMPVIILAPNNKLLDKIQSNIKEISARDGLIYIFSEREASFFDQKGIKVIQLPYVEKLISSIVYTIPLQILSYYVALIKGKNIDQPRNLAKSVTVE